MKNSIQKTNKTQRHGKVGRTWTNQEDPKITRSISIRRSVWEKAHAIHGRKLSAKIEAYLRHIHKE